MVIGATLLAGIDEPFCKRKDNALFGQLLSKI